MRIIGIAGWSGSGKTTLILRLIPILTARGLTVSTLKHAHHMFDVDTPGKDSYEHRAAGATEVLVASANRFALMHELRGAPEPAPDALLCRLAPVDLVLIEGFKRHPHPKIEVWRAANGKPLLGAEATSVIAIASDADIENGPCPVLPLDDVEAIAAFCLRRAVEPAAVDWRLG